MVKPVHLPNGKTWSKQGDALAHFKAMLARYDVGQLVGDPADHADLSALLQIYDTALSPEAEFKIGIGISHFSKQNNFHEGWTTAGFHVHRTDNSSIDFSYIEAVKAASSQLPSV